MFADAVDAKRSDLRVREDNPAQGVRGPDRGTRATKVYLYASEFSSLMECAKVPIRWQRAFAIATYLALRTGELNALAWEDADLERGTVLIHRSASRWTGAAKATKSKGARRVPVHEELWPLLRAMHDEAGGVGRVVDVRATDRKLSRQLRRCLELAGVKRAELFPPEEKEKLCTRKPMTFHDLRATGLTWLTVDDVAPHKIKQWAGHAALATTDLYIREAESMGPGFGNPFPPLPASLFRAGEGFRHQGLGFVTVSDAKPLVLPSKKWRRRESKPEGVVTSTSNERNQAMRTGILSPQFLPVFRATMLIPTRVNVSSP
jgi:hypothetical protein